MATAFSFALIVGILAWITTHPGKTPVASVAPLSPAAPAPATPAFLRPAEPPGRDEIVTLVRHVPPEGLAHRGATTAASTASPPSRPAESVRVVAPPLPQTKNAPPAGETYGTSVLFLNNPDDAAAQARHENKLLFVLHVSGNFEDSCFT